MLYTNAIELDKIITVQVDKHNRKRSSYTLSQQYLSNSIKSETIDEIVVKGKLTNLPQKKKNHVSRILENAEF